MKLIGLDIGGTNIRAGLVEDSRLTKVESVKINKVGSSEEVINDILSLIHKFDLSGINGICAGVPSLVDIDKGIIHEATNIPAWKEVHFKEILEHEFKIPAYINNDANCFVAGEKYFGKAKKYKDIVGLITGTGLGAGIIINNKLYAGYNGGAGEFGMISYKDSIYEHYCSGQFFTVNHKISGEECYERAVSNDPGALKIFAEYGSNLGNAVKMIMYAVDPEIIVLGGSVSYAFEFYKNAMWASINTAVYEKSAEKIKIEVSDLQYSAILGAAALFYDSEGMSPENIRHPSMTG